MIVRVVKVGGRPLGDPTWVARFAATAARSSTPLVVVHGGGPEIDELSVRLGVGTERSGGRRITSPAGLELAGMVLSGLLNKRLVSALIGGGVDALGLSGEDGALVIAELAEAGTLGAVGEVSRVRVELLSHLLQIGLTPVISPISRGVGGGALNVNADDVAVAVAGALGAAELLFLTDVPAVRDERGECAHLERAHAEALLNSGVVHDGMAVKVDAALRGLSAGIGTVRIGGLEMLSDPEAGTRLGQGASGFRDEWLLEVGG
jgi:acetylglutamate kinase